MTLQEYLTSLRHKTVAVIGIGVSNTPLLRRLLAVSMRKNLSLSQRIFCTTPKTVRGRLLTYFSAQAARSGSLQFEIPFNRQQLADYLNCDRSALSRELSLMQKDGLLDTFKSSFKLLDPDALKQMVQ